MNLFHRSVARFPFSELLMIRFLTLVAFAAAGSPPFKRRRVGDRSRTVVLTEEIPARILLPAAESPEQLMTVSFSSKIGSSKNSTVYSFHENGRDYAIKYTAFCTGDDGVFGLFPDPIALEAHFLAAVNAAAPDVAVTFYHSARVDDLFDAMPKLEHTLPVCPESKPVAVKYIIVEKGLTVLGQLLGTHQHFSLPVVAALGLQMVRLLRRVHDLGIAHGDIHLGNIAVSLRQRLTLIDFGLARRVEPERILQSETERIWCNGIISPWESVTWYASYRDDIFRMVQMMVFLLHGRATATVIGDICNKAHKTEDDLRHYYDYKTRANMFETVIRVPIGGGSHVSHEYSISHFHTGVPHNDQTRVIKLLADLLSVVRAPLTPFTKPDYERIEQILIEIRNSSPGEDPAEVEFHVVDQST